MTNPHEPVTPDGDTIRFPDGSELKLEPGDRAKYDKCPCGKTQPLADWERALLAGDPSLDPDIAATYEHLPPAAKPMRIRVMDLPGEINPETHELSSPFVMVFDRVLKDDLEPLIEDLSERMDGEKARDAVGARAFLFFSHEVQIGEDD
jgi:hypothetical protein